MTGFGQEDYEFENKYLTMIALELFVQKKENPPIYGYSEVPDCPDHRKQFNCYVDFYWNGEAMRVQSQPATSKKMSKHYASGVLLNRLGFTKEWLKAYASKFDGTAIPWPQQAQSGNEVVQLTVVPTSPANTSSSNFEPLNQSISSSSSVDSESTVPANIWNFRIDYNYIETLNVCCDEANGLLSNPEFTDGEHSGPSHAMTFTVHCTVYKLKSHDNRANKDKITVNATALDKKRIVKKMAALEMLKKLVTLYGQNLFPSLSSWPDFLQPGQGKPRSVLSPVLALNSVDSVSQQLNRIVLEVNEPGREGNLITIAESEELIVTQHYKMSILLSKCPTIMRVKDKGIDFNEENILDICQQVSEELGDVATISYTEPFGVSYSPENGTARIASIVLNLSVRGQQNMAFVGIGHNVNDAKCIEVSI